MNDHTFIPEQHILRSNFMKQILLLFFLVSLSVATHAQKVVHVYVALCDNVNQGIVPVPGQLGNGDDPSSNLYWGALYGVKTYFKRHADWQLMDCRKNLTDTLLERCIFKYTNGDVYLVADAYKGQHIKQAINDMVHAGAGYTTDTVMLNETCLNIASGADILAYIGHDGLMEFELDSIPQSLDNKEREAIILACSSKGFFPAYTKAANMYPLVWTTNLMAPEAYTLEYALKAWIQGADRDSISNAAAHGYHHYQKCGINGAKRLLVGGY